GRPPPGPPRSLLTHTCARADHATVGVCASLRARNHRTIGRHHTFAVLSSARCRGDTWLTKERWPGPKRAGNTRPTINQCARGAGVPSLAVTTTIDRPPVVDVAEPTLRRSSSPWTGSRSRRTRRPAPTPRPVVVGRAAGFRLTHVDALDGLRGVAV